MEILKIFSDEYDNERLYSVLLTEGELKYFNDKHETLKEVAKSAIPGTALVLSSSTDLGLSKTTDKLSEKLDKYLKNSGKKLMEDQEFLEESNRLMKKLKEKAKSQRIKIIRDEGLDNACFVGSDSAVKLRRFLAKMIKYVRKHGSPEDQKSLREALKKADELLNVDIATKHAGKQAVILGEGYNNPAALAHELGHAQYTKNRSKDILGKWGDRLSTMTKVLDGSVSDHLSENLSKSNKKTAKVLGKVVKYSPKALLIGGGFRRGKNSVKTDEEGNIKVNQKKALKSLGVGTAISLPLLISEGAASRQGLKMLKQAGASKKYMKEARKFLGSAYGTYASTRTIPVISQELGGHGLGVSYGIAREKIKGKKKHN